MQQELNGAARFQVPEEEAVALASRPVLPDDDPIKFWNPTKELQELYVGGSFEATYQEGRDFVNYVIERAIEGLPTQRVLDFGCGWGRMSRMLVRVEGLRKIEFHGCDIGRDVLDLVRRSVPRLWIQPANTLPPLLFRDGSVDVVLAYSVFSHLSERSALAWGAEFARILKPGGRLVITTQGERFLKVCENLRSGVMPIKTNWHRKLAESFADPSLGERYRAGEFLYASTHPDLPDYGEAVVPRSWFEREWGALGFRLQDWDESKTQNRFVMELSA